MTRPNVSIVLASLLLLPGCDDGASAAAEPKPQPAAKAEPQEEPEVAEPEPEPVPEGEAEAPEEAAEPEAPEEAEPEPQADDDAPAAYLEVDGKGWFVLTDDGPKTLPGGNTFLRAEPRVHDGRAYALTFDGVVEFKPSGAAAVAGASVSDSSIRDFTVAPDGSFWTLAPGKVSHLDDGSWKEIAFDVELPSDVLYTGLAVDADGEPWVGTAKAIFRRKDDAWVQAEFPGSKKAIFLQGLANAPTGEIYLPFRDRLFQLGDTATKVKARPPGYGSWATTRFAVGEGGTLFGVAEASTGAVMFTPKESARTVQSKRNLDVGYVSAVAVDGRGRIWLGGASGIVVSVAKGNDQVFPSGSIEGLSGKIRHLIVTGEGPELPKVSGELATGTLKGSVYLDDGKFANTTVELCPNPNMFFTRTPCAGEKPRFTTKTDAEGNFSVSDVPLGSYGVAVKVKGRKWQMSMFGDLGSQMKADETYDVGDIRLESKK